MLVMDSQGWKCNRGDYCIGQANQAVARTVEEPLKKTLNAYEHDYGWSVVGYAHKLWLSRQCGKCGYEWSLHKLGVPRPDGRI
jgi:hypothetical protein